jgi:hypothetical protein
MLKINFCDFWPGFEKNNLFLEFLQRNYDVTIDSDPQYLFFSVYGNDHLKFDNCIKILFTGENITPDFNLCDYALGFHFLNFEDRYLRFPLYIYYYWYYEEKFILGEKGKNSEIDSLEKLVDREFCNFIYSNNVNSDPFRDQFFHELSKYKRIDSGGKHLNNIGKRVEDKMSFLKNYKFTIAFENSAVPGYTTEKLLEPILMNSLPIYYGNPLVNLDFDIKSLVNVRNKNDLQRAIDEVIYLDVNDDKYIGKLITERSSFRYKMLEYEDRLVDFLKNIFEQDISEARRRPHFGFRKYYFNELLFQTEVYEKHKNYNKIKSKLKSIFYK